MKLAHSFLIGPILAAALGCGRLGVDLGEQQAESIETPSSDLMEEGDAPGFGGAPDHEQPGVDDADPGENTSTGGTGPPSPDEPEVEFAPIPGLLDAQSVVMLADEDRIDDDETLVRYLTSLGARVTIFNQQDIEWVDFEEYDLGVVSPSADAADVGDRLAKVETPLLILEPTIAESTGLGEATGRTDSTVYVEPPGHFIIGDLEEGDLDLCDGREKLDGNLILEEATPLITLTGSRDLAMLFLYEDGAESEFGAVPSRRVSSGLLKGGDCEGEDTWTPINRSLAWLLGVPEQR